jgi:aryl-alcohol dehydrogenase-like predicted oxidoreductase
MRSSEKAMNKSRLVLGTAQLGMKYGVANTSAMPTQEKAFAILDAALAAGINTFDTATAYGNSEEVLGEWIKVRALKNKVHVISKIAGKSSAEVGREIDASISRLQLGQLDGCLLHTPQAMYDASVLEALRHAKKVGLVANTGVSVYDPEDALQALELGLDYIQIPYNVFDRRLDTTDFFDRAKKSSVTVFTRSPFLQGLLLMKPDTLPPGLSKSRPYLERFIEIATKHELSQLEAAVGFVNQHCRADHIIFGVDSVPQLSEMVAAFDKGVSGKAPWIAELVTAFPSVDIAIIDPRLWKTT